MFGPVYYAHRSTRFPSRTCCLCFCIVFAVYSSRCLVCARSNKYKTSEIEGTLAYQYLIQTVLTFPFRVCVGLSHTAAAAAAAKIGKW